MRDTVTLTALLISLLIMGMAMLSIMIDWMGGISTAGQVIFFITFAIMVFVILYVEVDNS